MKKLGGCVGAGGTVGWAKTVSKPKAKSVLVIGGCPAQVKAHTTSPGSSPTLLFSSSFFSGSGSLSPKLAVCSTIGPRNYTGAPFHRSVLFMVVDSPQANLLFELRMRAVCGGP